MSDAPQFAYDRVLYDSHPMSQTHPDRLAALAVLFGMEPAPVLRCRVLEIGCGNGANLIPMALAAPDACFTGIDLACGPIATGRAIAQEVDARNCRFHHLDVMDLRPDFGEFDYVIAHGVYSWVPAAVRDKLIAVCRANLAPNGIAFVSYNTYPGCRLREITRDMMRYHTRGIEDPEARLKSALKFVDVLMAADPPFAPVRDELKAVQDREPFVLFHDDLADINHPVYFHEFIEHASRHDLQFLAEAQFHSMREDALAPATAETVRTLARGDRVQKQQYLDFMKCRRFRQTLLCRAGVPMEDPPDARRIRGLWASCPAQPGAEGDGEQEFRAAGGASIRTSLPAAKAALRHLCRSWPRAVPFGELLDCTGDGELLQDLLLRTYASGLVELHASPSPFVVSLSDRPRAFSLARFHARNSSTIPTLRHSTVRIEDALARQLILLLDGTRDRGALLRDLEPFAGSPIRTEDLERNLKKIARMALLEA